jgi:hypothetical protein
MHVPRYWVRSPPQPTSFEYNSKLITEKKTKKVYMTRDENDGLPEASILTPARIITDKMIKMLHGYENGSKGVVKLLQLPYVQQL